MSYKRVSREHMSSMTTQPSDQTSYPQIEKGGVGEGNAIPAVDIPFSFFVAPCFHPDVAHFSPFTTWPLHPRPSHFAGETTARVLGRDGERGGRDEFVRWRAAGARAPDAHGPRVQELHRGAVGVGPPGCSRSLLSASVRWYQGRVGPHVSPDAVPRACGTAVLRRQAFHGDHTSSARARRGSRERGRDYAPCCRWWHGGSCRRFSDGGIGREGCSGREQQGAADGDHDPQQGSGLEWHPNVFNVFGGQACGGETLTWSSAVCLW